MKKVIINVCYGGFQFSEEFKHACEKAGIDFKANYRTDPQIIELAEKIGLNRAGSDFSELSIEEIPENAHFRVNEYDGMESIETWAEFSEAHLMHGLNQEEIEFCKKVNWIKIV